MAQKNSLLVRILGVPRVGINELHLLARFEP